MIIADRERELGLFSRIVGRELIPRIMLVEAESGLGKSDLMRMFRHQCKSECVLIDLSSASYGVPYVLKSIRRELSLKPMPQLERALHRLQRSGIQISDVTMEGEEQQMNVFQAQESEEGRYLRLLEARDALFDDLSDIDQSLVILFDSYEQAPEELREWLYGLFLSQVVKVPHLTVVVASQQVPPPRTDWQGLSQRCSLGPIKDAGAWYRYTQARQLPLSLEEVKVLVDASRGHPRSIGEALETLIEVRNL